LPASKQWREIVAYLSSNDMDVARLAKAVFEASERSLLRVLKDKGFQEALWLLIMIPQAARRRDFAQALADIGLTVVPQPTLADIVVAYGDAVQRARSTAPAHASDLGEMASDAAISALASLFDSKVPALWTPLSEDIRTTLASFSVPDRFADLAHRFFSALLDRNLHYYVDRALPSHISPAGAVQSVGDLASFDQAVRSHCDEAPEILHTFARDWIAKKMFVQKTGISRKAVRGFAHVSLQKLTKELGIRGEAA
jgi:hypothetical protein